MQRESLQSRSDKLHFVVTWLVVAGVFVALLNAVLDWLFGAPFFGWPSLPTLPTLRAPSPPAWAGEGAWLLAIGLPAALVILAGVVALARLRDREEGQPLAEVLAQATPLHPVQLEARHAPPPAPDPALAGLLALHARLYPTRAALAPSAALADVAHHITRLEQREAAQRGRIAQLEVEARTAPARIEEARREFLERVEEATRQAAAERAARQQARQALVAERQRGVALEQQLASVAPTIERARQREAAARVAERAAALARERSAAALQAPPPHPAPLADDEMGAFLATVAFGEHVMPQRWQTRLGQRLRAESLALVRVESTEAAPSPTATVEPAPRALPSPRGERGGARPRIRRRIRRRIRP